MGQPDQGQRPPVDQPEIIEHVIGLGTDQLALAHDQLAAANADRGQALLGEQVLDQALAQGGIEPQVVTPQQGLGHQAGTELAPRRRQALELHRGRLLQLAAGHAGHQALAQHAPLGGAQLLLPLLQVRGWQARQPQPFGRSQAHGPHASLGVGGQAAHFLELGLELLLELVIHPGVGHLHMGAGAEQGAALFQGAGVHHRGLLGRPHGEGGRNAGPQTRLRQGGPTGEQGHQGRHHQNRQAIAPTPGRQGLARGLQP